MLSQDESLWNKIGKISRLGSDIEEKGNRNPFRMLETNISSRSSVPSTVKQAWQTTRPNRVIGETSSYISRHGVHVSSRDMFARRITIVVQLKRKQDRDLPGRMETGVLERER